MSRRKIRERIKMHDALVKEAIKAKDMKVLAEHHIRKEECEAILRTYRSKH